MISRKLIRYSIAGIINTIFGYFLGVILYLILVDFIDAYIISVVAGFLSIGFSIFIHRKFVFTSQNTYLTDLYSGGLVYGFVIVYSGLIFKIAIDFFGFSIFLVQAFVLVQGWGVSYILLNKVTFGNK